MHIHTDEGFARCTYIYIYINNTLIYIYINCHYQIHYQLVSLVDEGDGTILNTWWNKNRKTQRVRSDCVIVRCACECVHVCYNVWLTCVRVQYCVCMCSRMPMCQTDEMHTLISDEVILCDDVGQIM